MTDAIWDHHCRFSITLLEQLTLISAVPPADHDYESICWIMPPCSEDLTYFTWYFSALPSSRRSFSLLPPQIPLTPTSMHVLACSPARSLYWSYTCTCIKSCSRALQFRLVCCITSSTCVCWNPLVHIEHRGTPDLILSNATKKIVAKLETILE